MRVRIANVAAQNESLRSRLLLRLGRVLDEGRFVLGPEVERFEAEVARSLPVAHAIACSSGSDAIVLALLALQLGPGDEVITTPFSFFATLEGILRVGAEPRFADIELDSLGLDPRCVERAVSARTKAILGVHLFGSPAAVPELVALSRRKGICLVEDAAQAFGARLESRPLGTFGKLGCFSFQPTKPFAACGDAGLVVTDDVELAERCRRLRVHGAVGKHNHLEFAGNYRMDAVQAAVLSEKLPELPAWLGRRRAHAASYTRTLEGIVGLRTPRVPENSEPSWASYTVRVADGLRDELASFLNRHGIETAVHYPRPLHQQPAVMKSAWGANIGPLPNAERAAREVLSLPLYPELTSEELEYVASCVREFFVG